MSNLTQRILDEGDFSIKELQNSKEPVVVEALKICRSELMFDKANPGAQALYEHITVRFPMVVAGQEL